MDSDGDVLIWTDENREQLQRLAQKKRDGGRCWADGCDEPACGDYSVTFQMDGEVVRGYLCKEHFESVARPDI